MPALVALLCAMSPVFNKPFRLKPKSTWITSNGSLVERMFHFSAWILDLSCQCSLLCYKYIRVDAPTSLGEDIVFHIFTDHLLMMR